MTYENNVSTCPYIYTDTKWHGFLATHQPAQWMGESAEIAIAAGTGAVKSSFKDRGLIFSHDDEVSSPMYYKATLTSPDNVGEVITAELTSVSRAAAMRFTFKNSDAKTTAPFVVVQATRALVNGEVNIDPVNREITGYNPERQDDVLGPFKAADFKGYFIAKFDKEFLSYGTAKNSTLFENKNSDKGEQLAGFVTFDPTVTTVNVRLGLSFISLGKKRSEVRN